MLTIHTTLISQYLSCSCYSNGFWWIHSSKRKLLTTRFHNLAVLLPFLSRVIFTVRVQALSNLEQLQCLAVADTGVTSVCIYLNAILVVTGRDRNKAEGGWRGMGACWHGPQCKPARQSLASPSHSSPDLFLECSGVHVSGEDPQSVCKIVLSITWKAEFLTEISITGTHSDACYLINMDF